MSASFRQKEGGCTSTTIFRFYLKRIFGNSTTPIHLLPKSGISGWRLLGERVKNHLFLFF